MPSLQVGPRLDRIVNPKRLRELKRVDFNTSLGASVSLLKREFSRKKRAQIRGTISRSVMGGSGYSLIYGSLLMFTICMKALRSPLIGGVRNRRGVDSRKSGPPHQHRISPRAPAGAAHSASPASPVLPRDGLDF